MIKIYAETKTKMFTVALCDLKNYKNKIFYKIMRIK